MANLEECDVLVVGGGINGAGIARDAVGRGLTVTLCEQADLGNYTSSASTKLIHGGLRYLEHYELRLVSRALREREVLLGIAPHIIWPLRFLMPHARQLRPAWMIRAGLFLYDHLGGRSRLPGSRGVDLRTHPAGAPLNPAMRKGFTYSDCWVQDARLVVVNAVDAAERGATVLPRTRCVVAERGPDGWTATLRSTLDGTERTIRARALVNAAGPWVSRFLDEALQLHDEERGVQLVKGSHIVVPRLFEHDYAYVFQHVDGRIVFAIPYERRFTLIGTTEVVYEGDPAAAHTSSEEVTYLCEAVNRYFAEPVRPEDVVWTYAGVRPLYDEDRAASASAISRDYSLRLDRRGAPLLTVLGGKLTTYRTLAAEAVDTLGHLLASRRDGWTHAEPLPGGDFPGADFASFLAGVRRRYPWLPEAMAWRLAHNYGTRMDRLIGGAQHTAQLGEHFGADFFEAELRYLMDHEWAMTADDALWRRSKLGLLLSDSERQRVDRWMTHHAGYRGWEAATR